MNNKITIYELLGLVKDGQAPQRILYDSNIWIWTGDDYYARLKDKKGQFLITGMYYTWVTDFLNDEVEILDNEDEDIIIKQEQTNNGLFHDYLYYKNNKYQISVPQKVLFDEIDKIKHDINKLKKEGK